MNQLMQTAIWLADMGYRVFPCRENSKIPATEHGCRDATSDCERITKWWSMFPNANIGLSTDGLLVVDVDPLNDGAPNTFANDIEKLSDLLEAGYGATTPRGGQHFFFRQGDGHDLRNTAGKIAEGVDTRANGGYVLVAPSVVDGKPYRWMQGFELDCSPDGLPPIPRWVMQLLESESPATEIVDDGQSVIPDGRRNHTLTSIAGTLRRSGISQMAIEAALQAINQERCRPPMNTAEVSKIAVSVARYEPDQIAQAAAEGWADIDAAEHRQRKLNDPGHLPQSLYDDLGGFMGSVFAWSTGTAYLMQPELSLAATICLMSTLTGRKIADTTGIRTNLYCMGLCQSGGGKEHTRKTNKAILQASGLEAMIGPEGIGSHAGILSHLKINPVQLFQVDEFGRFLATLNNPAKSPHLFNVISVFLKLFTSADSLFIGDAVADTKRVPKIDQPHAVLYATTVGKSFFESLSKESLTDGFVSRLLLFESSDADPEPQDISSGRIPDEITDECRWWDAYRPGGNLSGVNPQPRVLTWSDDARAVLKSLDIACRARVKEGGETCRIWTRTVEKARKLSLLHAVSLDRESAEVTERSAIWGCWLSHHCTARMEFMSTDWVAENQTEAVVKRILRLVKASGSEGMTLTELARQTQWLSGRARQEAIDVLKVSGQIQERQEQSGGRPRTVIKSLF